MPECCVAGGATIEPSRWKEVLRFPEDFSRFRVFDGFFPGESFLGKFGGTVGAVRVGALAIAERSLALPLELGPAGGDNGC